MKYGIKKRLNKLIDENNKKELPLPSCCLKKKVEIDDDESDSNDESSSSESDDENEIKKSCGC